MTNLAIYAAYGLTLSAVGFALDSWQFWCLFALFFANGLWSATLGFDFGMSTMGKYVHDNIDAVAKKVREEKANAGTGK